MRKQRHALTSLGLVAFLGLSGVGCTGPLETPPSSIMPIDKAELVAAESNLKTDPILAGCIIKVTAENDHVVLSGQVPSETAKKKAEELVLKVRGIKKCANHLEVIPTAGAEENVPQ
jgi:hypothetical protein